MCTCQYNLKNVCVYKPIQCNGAEMVLEMNKVLPQKNVSLKIIPMHSAEDVAPVTFVVPPDGQEKQ